MSESLDDLRKAFKAWRDQKRWRGERHSAELLTRAGLAVAQYGLRAVVRATGADPKRLRGLKPRTVPNKTPLEASGQRHTRPTTASSVSTAPAFSRIQLTTPIPATPAILMEIELASGLRMKIFSAQADTLSLVTALCRTVAPT